MTKGPKRQRTKKSILVLMPGELLHRVDEEVLRRQEQGDMVTRSGFIRDALLKALNDLETP